MYREFEQSLGDHLEELAKRLRVIVFVLIIATFLVTIVPNNIIFFSKHESDKYKPLISSLMAKIQSDLLPDNVVLIAYSWLDTFYIYILTAFVVSFILTFQ